MQAESQGPEHHRRATDSDRLVSVAKRVSAAVRCAYCHDDLGELSTVCSGCQTALHAECRASLAKCPTLGCRASVFTLLGPEERMRRGAERPAFRRALANFAERHRASSPLEAIDTEVEDLRDFLRQTRRREDRAQEAAASVLAAGPLGELDPLVGVDAGTRAERLRRHEAEERERVRRALVESGLEGGRLRLGPDGYVPAAAPSRRGRRSSSRALADLFVLPFVAVLAALVLGFVYAPAFWVSLLTRRRVKSLWLDSELGRLASEHSLACALAPFALAVGVLFTIAFVAGVGGGQAHPALVAGLLVALGVPSIAWGRMVLAAPSA